MTWWWLRCLRLERVLSSGKMWRWAVLWHAFAILVVGATFDFRLITQTRQLPTSTQLNCFEYSLNNERLGRDLDKEWRPEKNAVTTVFTRTITPTFATSPLLYPKEISRRIDYSLTEGNDIVREHAKLVQDINSLKQNVFVAPIVDDTMDYDDSIFHEIIEASTSNMPRYTTAAPHRSTKTIPVILLGDASQRQVIKSQLIKFPKPTISLVGTSMSPLMKHPYPFVTQVNTKKPAKVCMTAIPMMYASPTQRPSLWQRILHLLIPR